jgi:hypothetical protein
MELMPPCRLPSCSLCIRPAEDASIDKSFHPCSSMGWFLVSCAFWFPVRAGFWVVAYGKKHARAASAGRCRVETTGRDICEKSNYQVKFPGVVVAGLGCGCSRFGSQCSQCETPVYVAGRYDPLPSFLGMSVMRGPKLPSI